MIKVPGSECYLRKSTRGVIRPAALQKYLKQVSVTLHKLNAMLVKWFSTPGIKFITTQEIFVCLFVLCRPYVNHD